MGCNYFNFTRQQFEEFIYDIRLQVWEPYINIILHIGRTVSAGVIVCTIPSDTMDTLVMDARTNLTKPIDEFIKNYSAKAIVSVSSKNENVIANFVLQFAGENI